MLGMKVAQLVTAAHPRTVNPDHPVMRGQMHYAAALDMQICHGVLTVSHLHMLPLCLGCLPLPRFNIELTDASDDAYLLPLAQVQAVWNIGSSRRTFARFAMAETALASCSFQARKNQHLHLPMHCFRT